MSESNRRKQGQIIKDHDGTYFVRWSDFGWEYETLRTPNIFKAVRWYFYGSAYGLEHHYKASENTRRSKP